MTKKKVISLCVAILIAINLLVIIPVVAFDNKNKDMTVTLDVLNDKRFYRAGDTVDIKLSLDNYNDLAQGIVGFEYHLFFDSELFENISFDKNFVKINSNDTYQVVSSEKNHITGLYIASIETPSDNNTTNTETDSKGTYYILPKNTNDLATFKMNVKKNISADVLQRAIADQNTNIILSARDENNKINTTLNIGKINVITSTPTVTVNGREYSLSTDLGIIKDDVTISSNRQDDKIEILKDDVLIDNKTLTENGNYKVKVTDITGKEVTVSFIISKVTLSAVSINTNPNKTSYFVGDKLDLTDATIVEKYSDGTKSNPIDITETMVDKLILDTEGTQKITVTHKGLQTEFMVTVDKKIEAKLERIEATTTLNNIFETQILTNDDFKVIGYYSDGSESEIFGFTIDEKYREVTAPNNAEITITYNELTSKITLPVIAREVSTIEIANTPQKTTYIENETQQLDLTGGKIKVNYNFGESQLIDMTDKDVTVTGFKPGEVSAQTITVNYKGFTADFEINVRQKQLLSIKATNPTKSEYYITQDVDFKGVIVTAKYDNNETKNINLSDCEISAYDKNTAGEKEITITYNLKVTTIRVLYKELEATNIELIGNPKIEYVEGNTLDISNLKIKVNYKEVQKTDQIPLTLEMVSDVDMNTVGTKTVTISYAGQSISYEINVKEKSIIDVKFNGELVKTEYLQGQDFDLSGINVIASYDNNTSSDVTDLVKVDFDKMTVDKNATVTVSYDKFSKQYNVCVLSRENVDLFNQAVNNAVKETILQDRSFYDQMVSLSKKFENDIVKMSALELQEVKDNYEKFKIYFEDVKKTVLPSIDNLRVNDVLSLSVEYGNLYFDEQIKVSDIKTTDEQINSINSISNNAKILSHYKTQIISKQRTNNSDFDVIYSYDTNNQNISVALLKGNNIEIVNSKSENGKLTFNAKSTDEFVLFETTKSEITPPQNDAQNVQNTAQNNDNNNSNRVNTDLAKTGDYANPSTAIIIISIIMVLAIVGLFVIIIKKKNK